MRAGPVNGFLIHHRGVSWKNNTAIKATAINSIADYIGRVITKNSVIMTTGNPVTADNAITHYAVICTGRSNYHIVAGRAVSSIDACIGIIFASAPLDQMAEAP